MKNDQFEDILARRIRANIVKMCHRSKSAHLASSLSCVEILIAGMINNSDTAYIGNDLGFRKHFILSKGHASMALYACLLEQNMITESMVESYNCAGSDLAEHPPFKPEIGIELATGSLGHGLPIACGMALASKIKKQKNKITVVMSDGECNEGSVWEAAMFAPAKQLNNLMVIVDYNKWQATGRSDEIMRLAPLSKKWETFGWDAVEVDGHNTKALNELVQKGFLSEKPRVVIAHTVKGKGISFMEDDNNWHYRVPDQQEVELALQELGVQ